MKQVAIVYSIIFLVSSPLPSYSRSVHRPVAIPLPSVSIGYLDQQERLTVKSPYLEPYPIFAFGIDDVRENILPKDQLTYHDKAGNQQVVLGTQLHKLIQELLGEIEVKKKRLSHFTILQNKNFNRRQGCGLLVLKFNDYPFVLKLFIETPKTFFNPYHKGIESISFFYMAGGANRHITGLTRIKNAALVKERLQTLTQWKDMVTIPRKWFWLPENPQLLILEGTNFHPFKKIETIIPAVYGLIADFVASDEPVNMASHLKKKIAMDLCNDLDVMIDPHKNNFKFKQAKNNQKTSPRHAKKKGKYDIQSSPFTITIIDTEHFPTMVGLKKKKKFRNYNSWITYLGAKAFADLFFRTKNMSNRLSLEPALALKKPQFSAELA